MTEAARFARCESTDKISVSLFINETTKPTKIQSCFHNLHLSLRIRLAAFFLHVDAYSDFVEHIAAWIFYLVL